MPGSGQGKVGFHGIITSSPSAFTQCLHYSQSSSFWFLVTSSDVLFVTSHVHPHHSNCLTTLQCHCNFSHLPNHFWMSISMMIKQISWMAFHTHVKLVIFWRIFIQTSQLLMVKVWSNCMRLHQWCSKYWSNSKIHLQYFRKLVCLVVSWVVV